MEPQKREEFIRNFNRHRPAIERYFAQKGFNSTEAEDLAQETFLLAYQGLEGFRGDAEFKTWLYRIAENIFKRAIRAGKALKRDAQEDSLDEVAPDSLSQSATAWSDTSEPKGRHNGEQLKSLLTREHLAAVREAVKEMPLQMRRCMVLYGFQQLSYQEIADVMKLDINTVKSHIFQARQRLKGRLGDRFDGFGR